MLFEKLKVVTVEDACSGAADEQDILEAGKDRAHACDQAGSSE